MTTEFKDRVKKEVEEDEQEEILAACKQGLRNITKKLVRAKEEVAFLENQRNVFLQEVGRSPKSAVKLFLGEG